MNQVQAKTEFLKRLRNLLADFGASIQAEDHWQGYAECGSDIRMTVTIPAVYDESGDCIQEYTEINLSTFIDYKD